MKFNKNTFFPQNSSALIFAMFLVMIVCRFFGGDVSSFFGRDFSSDIFPLYLYVFSDFLLRKCLLRDFLIGVPLQFFAGNVSSKLPW